MKNPMLRGNPAPTGFAASVSGYLRLYVYKARHEGGGLTISQRERIDRIDAAASLPVAVGDDDPRIRALALACPGGRWEPAPQQKAVLDGAGHNVVGETVTLTPDELLNAFVLAAMVDRDAAHQRELSQVKQGVEAAPTHEAMLQFEKDRADTEAAARKELQRENGNLRDEVGRERQKRREAQAVLMGGAEQPATASVPEPRALPKNVREHGKGFQGYVKVDGKTRQKTFPTPEEAAGWVAEQQNPAARDKAVSEAQNRRYEPDVSPEEMAAMQERATA